MRKQNFNFFNIEGLRESEKIVLEKIDIWNYQKMPCNYFNLSEKTGYTEDTIQKALRKLKSRGIIEKHGRSYIIRKGVIND